MAGVQANAHALRRRDEAQDFLQVLEPVPEAVARARGDFQADAGGKPSRQGVDVVQGPGDAPKPRAHVRVRARVQDEAGDGQSGAPPELLRHSGERALPKDAVLRRQVDEVAAVGDGRKRPGP